MDQRAYTIHRTECLSRQNPSLIRRKNPAKFENDCISRNGRRIKSTEPNLMILVSFSSAEDALSNVVKKYTTFRMQGTENPPFRFFLGDTRYSHLPINQIRITYSKSCFPLQNLVRDSVMGGGGFTPRILHRTSGVSSL